MTDREKVMKGLESIREDYKDMRDPVSVEIVNVALELLKSQEPRVMTLEEILEGCGHGYEEIWFEAEDGEPEYKTLEPCAWCRGTVAEVDDTTCSVGHVKRYYNKRYGMRIWSDKPTDEQREAVPWER